MEGEAKVKGAGSVFGKVYPKKPALPKKRSLFLESTFLALCRLLHCAATIKVLKPSAGRTAMGSPPASRSMSMASGQYMAAMCSGVP